MPTDSQSRRFRFSLRTLFVVVTVGCVWLGWQLNVVREWIVELGGHIGRREASRPSYVVSEVEKIRDELGDTLKGKSVDEQTEIILDKYVGRMHTYRTEQLLDRLTQYFGDYENDVVREANAKINGHIYCIELTKRAEQSRDVFEAYRHHQDALYIGPSGPNCTIGWLCEEILKKVGTEQK